MKQLSLLITVAGAAALSLESYLSLHGKSLCKTEACAIVSKYLTISEPLLICTGALYFWILALVLFFAARYPKLKYVPLFFLAPALAFDGSLIGFQVFTIQQKCILCFSVAGLLILITLLFCFSRKSFVTLICFILVWLGSFGVNNFIAIPAPQGASSNMTFFSTDHKNLTDTKFSPQITLIFSANCPHCLKVISFLADNYPADIDINLASIDSDRTSLSNLSFFIRQAPKAPNPFELLRSIKENHSNTIEPIKKGLKIKTKNGFNYLSNLGITNIPVLIVELTNKEKKILIGTEKIIPFLDNTLHPQS